MTKEEQREYNRQYHIKNKEKMKERKKECNRLRYLRDRERIKASVAEYRLNNPEKVKEFKYEYYLKNKIKIHEKGKNWIVENIEKHRKYKKQWQFDNPDKMKKYRRSYRKNHPEQIRDDAQRRRVMKLNGYHEKINSLKIYERDQWICQLCDEKVDKFLKWPDSLSPSLDHIIPLSKGGSHTMKNVQCAHLICNIKAGNKNFQQLNT